jgi:hypothetical protein
MSSNLRSPSQIGVRSKFLIGVAGALCAVNSNTVGDQFGNGGSSIIDVQIGALGPTATIDEITESVTSIDSSPFGCNSEEETNLDLVGKLFKDMGRGVTVYDSDTGAHIATYRQCQWVNAAAYEGVSAPGQYWIRVWAADGTGVAVARLG